MTEASGPGYNTYGRAFWRATLDRAVKSFAQAVILVWGVGDGVFNLFEVDLKATMGLALGATALSFLTSLLSGPVGPVDSPSVL
jgi:hypothetical protein